MTLQQLTASSRDLLTNQLNLILKNLLRHRPNSVEFHDPNLGITFSLDKIRNGGKFLLLQLDKQDRAQSSLIDIESTTYQSLREKLLDLITDLLRHPSVSEVAYLRYISRLVGATYLDRDGDSEILIDPTEERCTYSSTCFSPEVMTAIKYTNGKLAAMLPAYCRVHLEQILSQSPSQHLSNNHSG